MSNFKLLKKLERANQVCEDCGAQFGTQNLGLYLLNNGTCDICGDQTFVTNAKNWDYLKTGRKELLKETTKKWILNV